MPIIYERVFSKSPEKAVTAEKIPTRMKLYLQDAPGGSEITGRAFPVGTTINIRSILEWQDPAGIWRWLLGKTINVYHRLNTGVWEKIWSGTPTSNGYYDVSYTLDKAGVHTFYSEFLGDAEYAGCGKEAKSFAR